MSTATIAAGAKIQFQTGQWATLNKQQTAEIVSERFGVYKVLINGKRFSVDYKYVSIVA